MDRADIASIRVGAQLVGIATCGGSRASAVRGVIQGMIATRPGMCRAISAAGLPRVQTSARAPRENMARCRVV